MMNGEVQFASVENSAKGAPDEETEVVVAVGANYTQHTSATVFPTPYLGVDAQDWPVVEDNDNPSMMRRHIDATLAAYSIDKQGWFDRHLASSAGIAPPPKYLLVATNFCPFITYEAWQNYHPTERANLLASFDGEFPQLRDLTSALAEKVSLWIGHGLNSEVPVVFRCWQRQNRLTPWLLTSNAARPFQSAPRGDRVPFHLRERGERGTKQVRE
jgi:hypothetical protein